MVAKDIRIHAYDHETYIHQCASFLSR